MENTDLTKYAVPKFIPITMDRGSFSVNDIVESSNEEVPLKYLMNNFGFFWVCYVPGGFKQLRETGRIHFHHSWYLETFRVPSYGHFSEQVNE